MGEIQVNDIVNFEKDYTSKIRSTIEDIAKKFIKVGYLLYEVREKKLFKIKGYQDIYEYSYAEFGIKKTNTYNFIRICENFSQRTVDGQLTSLLNLKYRGITYTKLTEMISMNDSDREAVKGMTVKEIRKFKKIKKEEIKNSDVRKLKKTEKKFEESQELNALEGQMKFDCNKIIEVEYKNLKEEDIVEKDKNVVIMSREEFDIIKRYICSSKSQLYDGIMRSKIRKLGKNNEFFDVYSMLNSMFQFMGDVDEVIQKYILDD